MATKRKRGIGEGSLTKRPDGRWMARFYVTLPDGSRARRHITLKDKDEVMRRMRQEMLQSDKGLTVRNERHTVASWLKYWLADIDPRQVKDSTLYMHTNICHKRIIPEIGNISLIGLKPDHVRRMIVSWDRKGMGTRQQQIARNVLSAALRDAVKLEYVHRNVVRLTDKPKHVGKEKHIWSAEQVQTFLSAIEGHRYYGLFLILFHYGLRRGEACGLRWKDVNFLENIIQVRQQVYHIGHIQKIGSLKTAESQRDLALTPEIRKILLRKRALLGGNPDEEDLLFLTVRGTSVDGRSLLQFFNKITKEIGLPRLTIHEIRHTVASLLYTKGVPAKVAQGILGHKSIVTTLQVYTHSTAEERADAVTDLVSLYSDTRMSPTESSS